MSKHHNIFQRLYLLGIFYKILCPTLNFVEMKGKISWFYSLFRIVFFLSVQNWKKKSNVFLPLVDFLLHVIPLTSSSSITYFHTNHIKASQINTINWFRIYKLTFIKMSSLNIDMFCFRNWNMQIDFWNISLDLKSVRVFDL